MGYGGYGWT